MASIVLFRNAPTQRKFDPSSKKDLQELKFFKENNKWKTTCPFTLEYPYLDIPGMCAFKYTDYMLQKLK